MQWLQGIPGLPRAQMITLLRSGTKDTSSIPLKTLIHCHDVMDDAKDLSPLLIMFIQGAVSTITMTRTQCEPLGNTLISSSLRRFLIQ